MLVYGKAHYSEVGKKRGKVRRTEQEWIVVPEAVPAIISPDLWDAAQAKHGTRRFGIGRPWHRPYLLSGLIACGSCGKRFLGHKQSRGLVPAYYVCGSYHASGPRACDGLRVASTYLETAVVDGIQKRVERLLDRELLASRLRELLRDEAETGASVEALGDRLVTARRKIGRLVEFPGGRGGGLSERAGPAGRAGSRATRPRG